jgi:hypothetical protein
MASMRASARIVLAIVLASADASLAGGVRYVVASKSYGQSLTSYPVWASNEFAEGCAKAVMARDSRAQREQCDEGFAGLKPKVGWVSVGDRVELLESNRCGDMVSIRLSTGDVGCVSASALSSEPPPPAKEAQTGRIGEAPSGRAPDPNWTGKWKTPNGSVYIGSTPPEGSVPMR